jgi:hypothetical protein
MTAIRTRSVRRLRAVDLGAANRSIVLKNDAYRAAFEPRPDDIKTVVALR